MKIENATQNDVLKMVELGTHMFYESPHYRQFSVDGDKVFTLLSLLIDDPDGIVIVGRDEETNEVIGGFIGGVTLMWFSSETKTMYDNALFIHPSHRGGHLAPRLIKEAFKQAKEKGAVEAQLTNTTGVFSERVEKLYQYCGMTHIGGQYYKIL